LLVAEIVADDAMISALSAGAFPPPDDPSLVLLAAWVADCSADVAVPQQYVTEVDPPATGIRRYNPQGNR
jgi:hypothetical protein